MSRSAEDWEKALAAAEDLYGARGREKLAWRAAQRPDDSIDDLVRGFRAHPVTDRTNTFRSANLEVFARDTAPTLQQQLGRKRLRVGQIACSTGHETATMAAWFTRYGIPFSIDAYDVNPDAIRQARRATYYENELGNEKQRELLRPLFEPAEPGRWRGNAAYHEHVRFMEHDIIEGPPPGGPYDVILMNNLLYHCSEKSRNRIMANVLGRLVSGGIFVFDGHESFFDPTYMPWMNQMEQMFGLAPEATAGEISNQVRSYAPKWPTAPTITPAAGATSNETNSVLAVGMEVAGVIDALPFPTLQATIDQFGRANDTLASATDGSDQTAGLQAAFGNAGEHLFRAGEQLHLAADNFQRYLAQLGLADTVEI
ncbi:MAG TPA: CheR family methyltransferase [Patescibacteria group bacterium]|nr:CheR family methyltransferase [Patescibacteria group bacterium]